MSSPPSGKRLSAHREPEVVAPTIAPPPPISSSRRHAYFGLAIGALISIICFSAVLASGLGTLSQQEQILRLQYARAVDHTRDLIQQEFRYLDDLLRTTAKGFELLPKAELNLTSAHELLATGSGGITSDGKIQHDFRLGPMLYVEHLGYPWTEPRLRSVLREYGGNGTEKQFLQTVSVDGSTVKQEPLNFTAPEAYVILYRADVSEEYPFDKVVAHTALLTDIYPNQAMAPHYNTSIGENRVVSRAPAFAPNGRYVVTISAPVYYRPGTLDGEMSTRSDARGFIFVSVRNATLFERCNNYANDFHILLSDVGAQLGFVESFPAEPLMQDFEWKTEGQREWDSFNRRWKLALIPTHAWVNEQQSSAVAVIFIAGSLFSVGLGVFCGIVVYARLRKTATEAKHKQVSL